MTKSEWKKQWREWRLTRHLAGRDLGQLPNGSQEFDLRVIYAAHDRLKDTVNALTGVYK